MKKRKNNFIKLGILFVGISLLLWNCEKGENLVNEKINSENVFPKIEKVSFMSIQQQKTLSKPLSLIEKHLDKRKKYNTLSARNVVQNGFTILTNEVIKIEKDSIITYTFQVKQNDNLNGFQNFVIQQKQQQFYYHLLYYSPNNNAINPFYNVEYTALNEIDLDLSSIDLQARGVPPEEIDDGENGSGDDNTPGCAQTTVEPCSNGDTYIHGPEPYINGGYCSGSITIIDLSNCPDTTGDTSNPVDNTPNDPVDNNPPSGGGSNNTGSGNPAGEVMTAPTLPNGECPPGFAKNSEGICVSICANGKIYNVETKKCECPNGKVENPNGDCVEDPCKYINLQIQNPNYMQQANELEGKTGLKKETGYKQNKDGTQVPLNDTNNGHSLTIPVDNNTVGYMHTHLNDFLNGKIDPKTGNPILEKPIKIFSPKDLLKFLQIVKNSKYNGVPTHLVYGTVIASTGNYTLRFTGNTDDIVGLGSANSYRADYKKYLTKKFSNKEKAFLHFLKDIIGIDGINLYRIRDNGDVEKKTLKDNGNVDTNDCE